MSRLRRALKHLRNERGTTLIELLTVCLILSTVLGALITAFVAGSTAELDLNRRFQAQLNARLALDKIRREVHCASAVSPQGPSDTITLVMPAQCPTGAGDITYCMVSVTSTRWQLYRKLGDTCDSSGSQYADYVYPVDKTSGAHIYPFNFHIHSPTSLSYLDVDFPVNVGPAPASKKYLTYELKDSIYLRNSIRA
jgi:Tfp pilus assembly protein PilW